MKRIAVVLLNLGAPDSLSAVQPFLYNLFKDPAIINLSYGLRHLIAWIISRSRASKAKKIYEKLGGSSPLLVNTVSQQNSLSAILNQHLPKKEIGVFVAMRYWHPFSKETVARVKKFNPDKIVLLPLYPQFSTTTTQSSFLDWAKEAQKQRLNVSTVEVNDYPTHPDFIKAHYELLWPWVEKAKLYGSPRILFSAHGLPQKVIDAGDPYQKQVQQTVHSILATLPEQVDSTICYQSKVGPLKWLEPSTEHELKRAGIDRVPVVVVPVAFVSEHSETLVELDHDYKILSETLGVPYYGRVPALGTHTAFMEALADAVKFKIL